MKKLVLIALVLIIGFSMGLIWDHSLARAQGKEGIIKIGVCTPLSGPAAPWGIPGYHGVDLAVADLNAAGGIVVKGVTYKFQTVSYDDKCSVDTHCRS